MRVHHVSPAGAELDLIQSFTSLTALMLSMPATSEHPPGEYDAALKSFWAEDCPAIGSLHTGTAREVFAKLLRDSVLAEVQVLRSNRDLSWEQASALESLLEDRPDSPAYGIASQVGQQYVYWPFDVLVTAAERSSDPAHGYWLLSADRIMQRFGTDRDVVQSMHLAFADPDKRQAIIDLLPHPQQALINTWLQGGAAPEFELRATPGNLFTRQVNRLLEAQEREAANLAQGSGEASIATLGGFTVARSMKLEQWLGRLRRSRTPDWLKEADEQTRQDFAARGTSLAQCIGSLDNLLSPLGTYQAFAQAHLSEALRSRGIELDPAEIEVTRDCSFRLQDKSFSHLERLPLIQLAFTGLFEGRDGLGVELSVDETTSAAGLTPQLVAQLLGSADLRVSYTRQLRDRYFSAPVLQAVVDLESARLGTSLFAASHQGVLTASLLADLDGLRNAMDRPNTAGVKAYSVTLDNGRFVLTDVLVLGYPDDGSESLLLYAPQSPTGSDWLKCAGSRQVRHEIGGWIASEQGRHYLMDQVSPSQREPLRLLLEHLRNKAHLITEQMLAIEEQPSTTWREIVNAVALRQVERRVEASYMLTPNWYAAASDADRWQLARLDIEIAAMTREYRKITDIPGFAAYARNRLQAWFDSARPHDRSRRNVDDYMITLDGQSRSLVWLAMQGVERGTDVSTLPVWAGRALSQEEGEIVSDLTARFLEAHDIPTEFTQALQASFLAPSSDQKAWRETLHLRITQLEMRRACLQLKLDPVARKAADAEMLAVLELIADNLSLPYGGNRTYEGFDQKGLYHLQIKGEKLRGLYVCRNIDTGKPNDMLYTPQAPDGIWYRPIEKIGAAIRDGGLGPYLRDRSPHSHLPRFDRFIEKLEAAGYSAQFTSSRVGAHSLVKYFSREHDALVRAILEDVDASTVSKAERLSALMIERGLQGLSVLTLLFPPARPVVGALQVFKSLYEAAVSYRAGDSAQAAWHFLDAALKVASVTGVASKPQSGLLASIFKGPPPKLAEKMIDKFSDRLTGELDSYLRSVTIPEKGDMPSHAWLKG